MCVGVGVAFVLAVINRALRLDLLSRMAERVTFVLIPPLALIFLVLGTIFLGVATPTEGGAMGAVGALVMAVARRRLDLTLLRQAMDTTMKLSCFVLFILIGSTVFSLSFQAVDGPIWVEHLLTSLPGGQLGFLIVVNILIFFLAFFLDFFELVVHRHAADRAGGRQARHRPGLVRRAARRSTCRPRSCIRRSASRCSTCAASRRPTTTTTGSPARRIAPVTTGQIYWGAVPFVLIQIVMVGLIIAFPKLVSSGLARSRRSTSTRRSADADAGQGAGARCTDAGATPGDVPAPRRDFGRRGPRRLRPAISRRRAPTTTP